MEVNTRRDHRKHFRIARLFQLVLGKIILDRQDRFEINKIQNMRLESKYREMVLELEATWKITLLCTPGREQGEHPVTRLPPVTAHRDYRHRSAPIFQADLGPRDLLPPRVLQALRLCN